MQLRHEPFNNPARAIAAARRAGQGRDVTHRMPAMEQREVLALAHDNCAIAEEVDHLRTSQSGGTNDVQQFVLCQGSHGLPARIADGRVVALHAGQDVDRTLTPAAGALDRLHRIPRAAAGLAEVVRMNLRHMRTRARQFRVDGVQRDVMRTKDWIHVRPPLLALAEERRHLDASTPQPYLDAIEAVRDD